VSFRLMLLILLAFVYFGIGIGTLLKFNDSIPDMSSRAKMMLFLPIQTITICIMVYFEILPDALQNCIKKAKSENKLIVLKETPYQLIYTLCICLKFMPIMAAMLAQAIIQKNKSPKHVLRRARNKYSDIIGQLVLCN